MKGSLDEAFKTELKSLIIRECDIDAEIGDVDDDAPIFGGDSGLGLDSIDGLQIAIAIQNAYGIKITDGKEMRRVMTSINAFADFLKPE